MLRKARIHDQEVLPRNIEGMYDRVNRHHRGDCPRIPHAVQLLPGLVSRMPEDGGWSAPPHCRGFESGLQLSVRLLDARSRIKYGTSCAGTTS